LSDAVGENGLVTFVLGGGNEDLFDGKDRHLAVFDAETDTELFRSTGNNNTNNNPTLTWDMSAYKGSNVYFRLVDESGGGYGHILVDNIQFAGAVNVAETDERRGILRYDFDTADPAEATVTDWFIIPDANDGIDGSNLTQIVWSGWSPFPGISAAATIEGVGAGQDNSALGVIESPVFTIAPEGNGVVSFKHSGGSANTFFAAYKADGTLLATAPSNTATGASLPEATFDLSAEKGNNVYFRIVDGGTSAWDFKLIDDFTIQGTVDEAATITRRDTITPAIGLEVSLEGTELVWTVEDEVNVQAYEVTYTLNGEAKTQTVLAVDADFYTVDLPEGATDVKLGKRQLWRCLLFLILLYIYL